MQDELHDEWNETPPKKAVDPPEETVDPPEEPGNPAEAAATLADALNGETPADEGPTAEGETQQSGDEDRARAEAASADLAALFEGLKGANGLYLNRYKTPEEMIRALPEVDRRRGQLESRVGELEAGRSSPADWQPADHDAPLMRAACEACRLPPSQMAYSQEAVNAVVQLLGWDQAAIDAATPEDWRDARADIRALVGDARKDERARMADHQQQEAAQQAQLDQTFADRHPDLARPELRPFVDAVADDLVRAGVIRQGMSLEQALDLTATETKRRMSGFASPQQAPAMQQPPPPARSMVTPISGGGPVGGGGGRGGAAFVDDGNDFFNA